MQSSHSAIRAFAQFVLYLFDTASIASMSDAATEACAPHRRKDAVSYFVDRGFDSEEVTLQFLEDCATACGWHKRVLRPLNTFKDMLECIKQYGDGLVTEGELIMAVQMVPHQVVACSVYNQLPLALHRKASLADWDDNIACDVEKGVPPKALWY